MTSWVRLWHDMPTDPKFRTIARAAKQPLPVVVSIFTFMLTDASANESERGRTTATDEDIASAFDLDEDAVSAVRQAMQGRVLDGERLAGWSKRQPKKEDDSAERAKAWRAKKQAEVEAERLRTTANDSERPDAEVEADKKEQKAPLTPKGEGGADLFDELVAIVPHSPASRQDRGRRWFIKQTPEVQQAVIAAGRKLAAWFWPEQQRKGRSRAEAIGYAPSLHTWLIDGGWKSVGDIPSQPVAEPMVKLDRERDADLWRECEAILGKPAPTSDMSWSFRQSVVEQARQRIAA